MVAMVGMFLIKLAQWNNAWVHNQDRKFKPKECLLNFFSFKYVVIVEMSKTYM